MNLQADITAESPAKLWSRIKTVAVSTTTASGDATIHTTTTGLYFVVFYLFLASSAAIDVTVKSGSTAISGAIAFSAAAEKTWTANGFPVFKGRATGEAFILNASGSTSLRGFALVAEVQ